MHLHSATRGRWSFQMTRPLEVPPRQNNAGRERGRDETGGTAFSSLLSFFGADFSGLVIEADLGVDCDIDLVVVLGGEG